MREGIRKERVEKKGREGRKRRDGSRRKRMHCRKKDEERKLRLGKGERTGRQCSVVEVGRKRGSKHEVRKDVKGGVC
jgi:hypothetical protein